MKFGKINRRQLLQGVASFSLAGCALDRFVTGAHAASSATVLNVDSRVLDVNGKAAKVYGLTQSNGFAGLETVAGLNFQVSLVNRLDHDTLVHWHGLTPPSNQDGVPGLSQPPLKAKGSYEYEFPLERSGTYWMHSHVGLQEQQLLAAPLIVHDPAEAGLDEQNVVIMLHDFTHKDPVEILHKLRSGGNDQHDAGMPKSEGAMPMTGNGMSMDGKTMDIGTGGTAMAMEMDLNDVEFDAYLANDRTLADPEVVRVEAGAKVRLRIINAAASTNFVLDLAPSKAV